jgi:hypothetical protein
MRASNKVCILSIVMISLLMMGCAHGRIYFDEGFYHHDGNWHGHYHH